MRRGKKRKGGGEKFVLVCNKKGGGGGRMLFHLVGLIVFLGIGEKTTKSPPDFVGREGTKKKKHESPRFACAIPGKKGDERVASGGVDPKSPHSIYLPRQPRREEQKRTGWRHLKACKEGREPQAGQFFHETAEEGAIIMFSEHRGNPERKNGYCSHVLGKS